MRLSFKILRRSSCQQLLNSSSMMKGTIPQYYHHYSE